jgi:hypothetical protein
MEFPRIPTYGIHPPTAGVSGRELWRCFFFPGVSGELCCAASRRSKEGPRARRASDPQASLQIAISIFLSPHPSPVLAEEQPAAHISKVLFICLFLHFYVARAFSSYAELHVRTWYERSHIHAGAHHQSLDFFNRNAFPGWTNPC